MADTKQMFKDGMKIGYTESPEYTEPNDIDIEDEKVNIIKHLKDERNTEFYHSDDAPDYVDNDSISNSDPDDDEDYLEPKKIKITASKRGCPRKIKRLKITPEENEQLNVVKSTRGAGRPSVKKSNTAYQCPDCDEVFNTNSKYQYHQDKFHRKNPQVSCEICGKLLFQRDLKRHLKHQHSNCEFECQECGQKFTSVGKLRGHVTREHKRERYHKCPQCEKQFYNPNVLRDHIAVVHEGIKFTCQHCGKECNSKPALRNHISSKHSDQKFSCDQCELVFSNKKYLRDHVRNQHPDEELQCDQCDFKTTSKPYMKKHVSLEHLGNRHTCDECGKSYKNLVSLKEHVENVHKGIKYQCHLCGHKATVFGVLKLHIKTVHKIPVPEQDIQKLQCQLLTDGQ